MVTVLVYCTGVSLALDRWPVATWFGLRATYFWILLARTGHLCSKPNLLKIIINQFFCKKKKYTVETVCKIGKSCFFLKFHLQNNNWKCGSWNFDLGHLNLIRATSICQSLARIGHQLSKLNDTPAVVNAPCNWKEYLSSAAPETRWLPTLILYCAQLWFQGSGLCVGPVDLRYKL